MAEQSRIVLVGSGAQPYRAYAFATLAPRHELVAVLADEPTWQRPYLVGHRVTDTTDPGAVAEAIAELTADGVHSGVLTWDETLLETTAVAAAKLGMPHLDPVAARNCRDKFTTRTLLAAAGLSPVRYRLARTEAEARSAGAELGFPVVVKPRALAGSIGVVLARDEAEVVQAYREADSAAFPGLPNGEGVLVEEFLDGPEVSVDSVALEGRVTCVNVARKRLGFAPHFEEIGHLVTQWQTEPWAAALTDLVTGAHRALGVTHGVTHAEVRLTSSGPRLVELNGRLGGDLIPYVGARALGVDLVVAAADLALGREPDLRPGRPCAAEVRFLYPSEDCDVRQVDVSDALNVPGVTDALQLAPAGSRLLLPPRGLLPRLAAVVAVAPDAAGCAEALDAAEAAVAVSVEPLGEVTARRYHAGVDTGPPVAASFPGEPLLRTAYGSRFLSRPVFLDRDAATGLDRDLQRTFDLLVSLPDRLFGGDLSALAIAVGMAPVQVEAVLRSAAVTGRPERIARADLYREAHGFRLLEFNMGSALGGFENAEINRAFLADPAHRRFVATEGLTYVDTLREIVDTMLRAVGPLPAGRRPVVALADWPSSFATLEPRLHHMAALMAPMGLDAVPCHVGQLTTGADGSLLIHDRRVDIVYRFFLIEDLLDGPEAPSMVGRVLDAVERGTVALFAALNAELYGNKGCLALMTDEENRHLFSDDELAFLDRFLPWTRAVRSGSVRVGGRLVDLRTQALAERAELVLKPTLLHGGIGVVCGWTVSDEEWRAAIDAAMGGPFVLQRRVRPIAEPFPRHNGRPGTEPLYLNWGTFLTDRGYSGSVVRGSADADVGIVSMANGARVGCCFHASEGRAR